MKTVYANNVSKVLVLVFHLRHASIKPFLLLGHMENASAYIHQVGSRIRDIPAAEENYI